MLKNYFPSNLRTITSLIIILLYNYISFGQQTATITTTSTDANWAVNFNNSGGTALSWLASGSGLPADIVGSGNNPSFDFSTNDGSDITITITSTDNFDFVTVLLGPGRDITDVDLANMENIKTLELPSNNFTSIDLSTNTALERLVLDNNSLTTINLTKNINLDEFDASFNDITIVNIAGLVSLELLQLNNNELVTIDISSSNQLSMINLDFNLLPTEAFNQILNTVDDFGTGGFGHILSLTGNPGDIPASAINAYNNLLARNWIIRPPVIYDFGDAPNIYGTDMASGGPQHIIGDANLKLGLVIDDEFNGFPGVNADGDDLDKFDDEDGVNRADLLGISTSTDNFSVDVDYTNNTSSTANLYAWIDFDGNGSFDTDEFSTITVPANGAGTLTLTWVNLISNGVDINSGDSYVRFRITTDILSSNQSGGAVNNGEVEDYALVIQGDFDLDGVFDSSDSDADNDGILNTDEVGDSNGNGIDDMFEFDSDDDGCSDVAEAGFLDGDGDGILGTSPVVVDANGLITEDALGPIGDGFTTPNDLDNNSVYDFQEAGASAIIMVEPTDQDLIIGTTTFSVVATADTYQWQEDKQDGNGFIDVVDEGDYWGRNTANLSINNYDDTKLNFTYRVVVSNIAFACDFTTISVDAGYIVPEDSDIILEYSEFEENSPVNELTKIFFINNIYTPHSFTLVDGNGSDDNDDFSITEDVLSKKIIFDYETKKEYLIRIKAEDSLGFSMEKSFVIKVINLNDIVITGDISNNLCSLDESGAIETSIDQVIPPLTFLWSSGETTQNISNKESGNYTFTVTDAEGMEKSKLFEIETLPIYNDLSICYVTSDDVETINNRIFINNDGAYNIDKMEILREGNVQGQYDVIGEIEPNQDSYLDVSSNNETISYNYKVRIKDNCGANSESSSLHKTILLQANKAADGSINLNWSAYEGITYGTYDIYRMVKQSNSQFELLVSISASNLNYNDTDANSNTKSYSYYIAISLANACSFSPQNAVNKSSSALANDQLKSNIRDIGVVLGVDDEVLSTSLKIYPNPVTNVLTVKSRLPLKSIEIYNLLGQEVKQVYSNFESINLEYLSKGIYMIKISSENGSTIRKLIKK